MDNTQRRPLQIVRNTVKVVAQMDWLGYLTGVMRVISELAPSPVLSSVASIVLLILEPLETLRRNRGLFRNLAEKVVRITVLLRNEVVADESLASSPRFVRTCVEFHDCLLSIEADLRDILRRRRSWVGQYFSAYTIRSMISDAQKRVDGLVEGFMLATVVSTRFGVQRIHADFMNGPALTPLSSNAGAEPKFCDFYKLIPADLQCIPHLRHGLLTETLESPIEYSVLVRGARMTARLYRGENALEQWREDFHLFSSLRDPSVGQLFGYCDSPRQLALVFHSHDVSLPNPDAARFEAVEQELGCGCACGCGTLK